MTQRKVKKEVILISSLVLLLLSTLTAIELKQGSKKEEPKYVNKTIFENDIPVISEKEIISRPYTDNAVRLVKSYYEKSDDEEKQKNSLIFYENTYLPSTGVDYQADYNFDIVSILDGEVLKVTEDQILGNIVEIKHNDDIISSYQSLSEVTIKMEMKKLLALTLTI